MSEITNRDRAEWAQQALEVYSTLIQDDPAVESSPPLMQDLLTDMMHLARFEKLDFSEVLRLGNQHYEWETEEDLDDEGDESPPGYTSVKDWSPKDKRGS